MSEATPHDVASSSINNTSITEDEPSETLTIPREEILSPNSQARVPFTSSTKFRTELTTKLACEVYDSRLAYIEHKREPCSEGVGHDFKNHAAIVQQLRELAIFASAQSDDAENAILFQKKRLTELEKQEEQILQEFKNARKPIDIKLWELNTNQLKFRLVETGFYIGGEMTATDDMYFYRLKEPLLEIELYAATEKEAGIRKSLLLAKMDSYIIEAKLERFTSLNTQVHQLLAWISRCGYQMMDMPIVKNFQEHMPELFDTYDKLHAGFINEMVKVRIMKSNASNKIKSFGYWANRFKKYQEWCSHDADFAQSLSHFTGPFRILDCPREIRNEIFSLLLTFRHNLSETKLLANGYCTTSFHNKNHLTNITERYDEDCRPTFNATLWSHPLFITSRQIRQEATEQFYRHNSFASRSLATLSNRMLSPDFRNLIADLSITWPSLGALSCQAFQELKSFKGLRHLKIYLNWEHLSSRTENSLDGVRSFELLLNHSVVPALSSIQKVEVFEVRLSAKEQLIQSELLDHISSAEQEHSLFGEVGIRRHPKPPKAYGYRLGETAKFVEENFDRALSARILDAQTPYPDNDGRSFRKPSSNWDKLEKKNGRRAFRLGITHVPIVSSMEKPMVKAKLEEIRSSVIEKRSHRLEAVARETARREAVRIQQFNLAPYSREEAAGEFFDSTSQVPTLPCENTEIMEPCRIFPGPVQ